MRWLLLLTPCWAHSAVVANGNPHIASCGSCECPAQRLWLENNLVTPLRWQAESFLGSEEHEVQGLKLTLGVIPINSRVLTSSLEGELALVCIYTQRITKIS